MKTSGSGGLAKNTLTSFKSFQWNTIYMRHVNGNVIISDAKNDLSKSDATWEIVKRSDLKSVTPVKPLPPVKPKSKPKKKKKSTNCSLIKKGDTKNNRSTTRADLNKSLYNEIVKFCRNKGGVKDYSFDIVDGYDGLVKHYLYYDLKAYCNCN